MHLALAITGLVLIALNLGIRPLIKPEEKFKHNISLAWICAMTINCFVIAYGI